MRDLRLITEIGKLHSYQTQITMKGHIMIYTVAFNFKNVYVQHHDTDLPSDFTNISLYTLK